MIFMKNDIRVANIDDYIKVRKLWDDTFKEDSIEWRNWYFANIYRSENTFIIADNREIDSMAHFNPYPMILNSKQINTVALAGVATRTDIRKKGYAESLIKDGLNEMNKRGYSFSFLYPFNYDFYRKYGYQLCYENNYYTIQGKPDTDIKCEVMNDSIKSKELYQKFAQKLNGYIIRDSKYQEIKFKEHFADGNKAFLIKKDGHALGYALAHEEANRVVIDELICKDVVDAAKGISAYYNKSVEFTSPYIHSELTCEVKPHCMGRVLDVIRVFDNIPAKDNKIIVQTIDDVIAENNDCFVFEANDGMLNVTRTKDIADIKLDIKEISAIATGFTKGLSVNARSFYNSFFQEKTPWIVEVC